MGCVFTQTTVDDEGYPVRDEVSTTYVGAIESCEEFGRRLYTEACRPGLGTCRKTRGVRGRSGMDQGPGGIALSRCRPIR